MKRLIAIVVSGIVLSVAGITAEKSDPLTSKQVKQLTATASTPADHLKLAKHWEATAKKLEAESKEHAEMAKTYSSNPTASETKRPGSADTSTHCERLSQDLAKAASDARALALDHQAMAKQK